MNFTFCKFIKGFTYWLLQVIKHFSVTVKRFELPKALCKFPLFFLLKCSFRYRGNSIQSRSLCSGASYNKLQMKFRSKQSEPNSPLIFLFFPLFCACARMCVCVCVCVCVSVCPVSYTHLTLPTRRSV